MTAEIAILNRSAVALAADSALTVGYGDELKTYHTHKLFMLSKANPVGIMIFNNASMLGVPWETIIKYYRKHEGGNTFDHLFDYAKHFQSFLRTNTFFFPQQIQDNHAISEILSGLIFLRNSIDDEIAEIGRRVTLSDINAVTEGYIEAAYETIQKVDLPPTYPPDHRCRVYSRYVAAIELLIDEVFQTLPLTSKFRKQLRRFGLHLLLAPNALETNNYTGLVIAGFGEKDLYPAIEALNLSSLVLGELRYFNVREKQIEPDSEALIFAFAEKEMVQGFMNGMTPDLGVEMVRSLRVQLDGLLDSIRGVLPRMTAKKKEVVTETIREAKNKFFKTFLQEMRDFTYENISHPIVRAVAVLPKEELAVMAETLVNLTSFKRRVTLDLETVGGPIDVAIISKGDGFIWIQRKHYFEANLNPRFFKNHL